MDQNQKLNAIVNKLVNATDPEEVKRSYKEWANTYDSDLNSFGYVAPHVGVELLTQRLVDEFDNVDGLDSKGALILDAGCGTGLVGALLSKLGYSQLHGFDFSTSMLEKASLTGHYADLQVQDFSGPLATASNTYHAVISIGVYTKRFDQHFIAEMIRITRPSGYFVFSCREMYFGEVMDSVSSLLKAKAVSRVTIDHDDYMTGQDASAYYIGIKK